ncbi:MAG: hypothetical protein JJU23_09315 [Cyclobacteriaceae bacterium]|nr:hypothetical protein [Cyclobacteriaceae bacterium]
MSLGKKYQSSRYGRDRHKDIHLTERAERKEIFLWKILAKSLIAEWGRVSCTPKRSQQRS